MLLSSVDPFPQSEMDVSPLGGSSPPWGTTLTSHFPPQVSLNAWFWSTVFHTRDTDLTEVSALPPPFLLETVPGGARRGGTELALRSLLVLVLTRFTEHLLCAGRFKPISALEPHLTLVRQV